MLELEYKNSKMGDLLGSWGVTLEYRSSEGIYPIQPGGFVGSNTGVYAKCEVCKELLKGLIVHTEGLGAVRGLYFSMERLVVG